MIKLTKFSEIDEILHYIGNDYKSSPYLYANLKKYGLRSNSVDTWYDKDSNGMINAVYLRYYDCIHFYSRDTHRYPLNMLISFCQCTNHKVLMVQGDVGNRLENQLLEDYFLERNHIIDLDNVGLDHKIYRSEIATRSDIIQIVDLLMSDKEYINVYNKNILSEQLFERFDTGFSRYFVIKVDGKVVATCSTYGEVPGFALLGGVIVHPDYRRRGFASDVENFACHLLACQNISKVGFVNYHNVPSLALHEKLGARIIASLAKFVKK